jgi:hypothetical protein
VSRRREQTPEERQAGVLVEDIDRLIAHLTEVTPNPAAAGLLLCGTLMALISIGAGFEADEMSLREIMLSFIALTKKAKEKIN